MSARYEVVRYVTRLIDYGKGHPDPELDQMTTGQVADRIITSVKEGEEYNALEVDNERLRASLDRVRKLAIKWQRNSIPGMTNWDYGEELLSALMGEEST